MSRLLGGLRVAVAVEAVILACMCTVRYMPSKLAVAAHDTASPESFVITITGIEMHRQGGGTEYVFSGKQEVDLAAGGSMQAVLNIDSGVPSGTYTGIRVSVDKSIKVKGSVLLDGTTYYTKADHANPTTGPAEVETITRPFGDDAMATFATPLVVNGPVTIRVLGEIAESLMYWDGNGGAPVQQQTSAGMGIARLAFGVVVGAPGTKEVYHLTINGDANSAVGRLSLIFDSSGSLVGAVAKTLQKSSKTSSVFQQGGQGLDKYEVNTNGTVLIQEGQPPTGSYAILQNFQRASHTGTYSRTGVAGGISDSGTYTATRVE